LYKRKERKRTREHKLEGDQCMQADRLTIAQSSSLPGARAVTGDVVFGPAGIAGAFLGLRAVLADMTDGRAVVAF